MFNHFSPTKSIESSPQSGQLDLHDAFKNSYSINHKENMNDYMLDKKLSNNNQ